MQPEIHLGGLTFQTFGIMFVLAVLAGIMVLDRRFRELGKPGDWAWGLVFSAVGVGFIGARLDAIVENYSELKHDLLVNLFSGSALIWYGGVVGGLVGALLWGWRHGLLNLAFADLIILPLPLGYAIGRIGCQLSGDGDYGKAWDGPWAMAYPHGTDPTTQTVHPTPIYETLAMGLLAYALWRLRDRFRPGVLFALYLFLAGGERFLVEFVRRNDRIFVGLTQAQLISLAMIVIASTWLVLQRRRGPLALPAGIGLARAPYAA
jgi:phosphatidylglycerol:prolipoprotein diacylglycerol transferase